MMPENMKPEKLGLRAWCWAVAGAAVFSHALGPGPWSSRPWLGGGSLASVGSSWWGRAWFCSASACSSGCRACLLSASSTCCEPRSRDREQPLLHRRTTSMPHLELLTRKMNTPGPAIAWQENIEIDCQKLISQAIYIYINYQRKLASVMETSQNLDRH